MRFLGGKVHGNFQGEIVSEFNQRPEGIRVKLGSQSEDRHPLTYRLQPMVYSLRVPMRRKLLTGVQEAGAS
jgi:hypothetical protein